MYIEYYKNSSVKAYKLFHELITRPDPLTVDYVNNDAALQATVDQNTALLQLTTSGLSLPDEVRYNEAHWHLFSGNVPAALQIFKLIARSFSNNPKLWLRLAECYVQTWLHACRLQEAKTRSVHILKGQVGDHSNRKVIINTGKQPVIISTTTTSPNRGCGSSTSDAEAYQPSTPHPSISVNGDLIMARGCLMNALMLLSQDDTKVSFYPSNLLTENELKQFKISLHLQLVYVNLKLKDYYLAERYVLKLLNHLQPNALQRALANSYMSEILVHLCPKGQYPAKMEDMINTLQESSKALTGEIKLIQQDSEYLANSKHLIDWDVIQLNFVLQYNSMVALTFQGDPEQAIAVLKAIQKELRGYLPFSRNLPFHFFLLEIYLLKKLGEKTNFDCVTGCR